MTDVSLPPPMPREAEPPTTQVRPSHAQSSDACGSCGSTLATDQRYCLECGQRRGDPRLPFMDAVVVMDAVNRPAPAPAAPAKRSRAGVSPNAALIAGVGTLLLALGIGVLIGRSGHQEVAQTAAAPQIIRVGGGEGGAGSQSKTTTGGGAAASAKTKKQKEAALKKAEEHPAAEDVLKPAAGVTLPPSTVKPGDKCEEGAAGCENGEFTGDFFGE